MVLVVLVLTVGICGVGGFAFLASGGLGSPENSSPETPLTFAPAAPGASTSYDVTVHFSEKTPPGTEGIVAIGSNDTLASGELTLRLTPQDPPGVTRVTTDAGKEVPRAPNSARTALRGLALRNFTACRNCDMHFLLVATAGVTGRSVTLTVRATAVGYDAEKARATPTVTVRERSTAGGPTSRTVAVEPVPASAGVQVHYLTVRGEPEALRRSAARLVATTSVAATSDTNSDSGATLVRADDPATSRGATERASAPGASLPLAVDTCAVDCAIGLWIIIPDGARYQIELTGQGELLTTSFESTRSSTVDEKLQAAAGSPARRLATTVSDGPGADTVQSITVAQFTSGGTGNVRGRLDGAWLDLGDVQLVLTDPPCRGDECREARALTFDGVPGSTVTLTATSFSVVEDERADPDLVRLTLG